jgi:hypothetical protein
VVERRRIAHQHRLSGWNALLGQPPLHDLVGVLAVVDPAGRR